MEADMFLDEVLSRVKEFLASSQTEDEIRPSDSHTSLSRTSDLKLPLEGRGLDAALDDIEAGPATFCSNNSSWFHEPALGWAFPSLQSLESWLLLRQILRCILTRLRQLLL